MEFNSPKAKFVVSSDIAALGSLEVYEEGILLSLRDKKKIMKGYITSLEAGRVLPLGRIEVKLSYYDPFGESSTINFAMVASDFKALKAILEK